MVTVSATKKPSFCGTAIAQQGNERTADEDGILARIFHELLSRDHEDGRATGQPQGVGSEAYLNGTSQGELVLSVAEGTPEDARKDGHIHGRSSRFMNNPGSKTTPGG
jgi:hypothetical protein